MTKKNDTMKELTELTSEEKLTVGSGFILSLFVIDLPDFFRSVRDGFTDGLKATQGTK